MITEDQVMDVLHKVKDPEMALSVADLGLIYDLEIKTGGEIVIEMTLTTPACPYGPILVNDVKKAVGELEGVTGVTVDIVWDPPWNPEEHATDYAKDVLGIW